VYSIGNRRQLASAWDMLERRGNDAVSIDMRLLDANHHPAPQRAYSRGYHLASQYDGATGTDAIARRENFTRTPVAPNRRGYLHLTLSSTYRALYGTKPDMLTRCVIDISASPNSTGRGLRYCY
jgi:hypothetical protein